MLHKRTLACDGLIRRFRYASDQRGPGRRMATTAGMGIESRKRYAAEAELSSESRSRLARLADLTLAEFARHLTRWGESGTILEEDGLLLFAGAHPQPNPYRNGAIRLEPELAAAEVLARVDEFFTAHGRGFALWASEHADDDLACARDGTWLRRAREPARARPARAARAAPASRRRGNPRGDRTSRLVAITCKVVAEAWGMGGMPHEIASRIFFSTASVDVPNVAAFVAYIDGYPVSGAMTLVTHGVALGCQAATVRRLPAPVRALARLRPSRAGRTRRRLPVRRARAQLRRVRHRISLCQTSSLGAPVWLSPRLRAVHELPALLGAAERGRGLARS